MIPQRVLFPEGSVRPFLQQQGNSCYRHSAFCALANNPIGQNMLAGMIQHIGGDKFSVTFPGVAQQSLTIMSDIAQCPLQIASKFPVLQSSGSRFDYVTGSLGTRLISHAYTKVEGLLNDLEKFDYSPQHGGDAALVLRRLTGWDSIWFTNAGTLLKFNPSSLADYPKGMKEIVEFEHAYPNFHKDSKQLVKFEGVLALLREASQNFDRYMLVAGSREFIADNPLELPRQHAFAITSIDQTGEGLSIELVDPKDTSKPAHRLNEFEFIHCFRKISGVIAPS